MSPSASPPGAASERYEHLRALARRGKAAGGNAAGVRVVERWGVAAWMEGSPGGEAAPGLASAAAWTLVEPGRPPIRVAAGELARLLAGMLLGEGEEAR